MSKVTHPIHDNAKKEEENRVRTYGRLTFCLSVLLWIGEVKCPKVDFSAFKTTISVEVKTMAQLPATVSFSGPALSFLLFETSREPVRQYGFLMGEIIQTETTLITDNDQNHVNIARIVKINSIMPFASHTWFGTGRVDKEELKEYLGPGFTKVVAWYKFSHSPTMEFTLKERLMHDQFKNIFEAPPDLFPVCFLKSEASENFATHSFQQNFALYENGYFVKLDMCIPNLGDPNNMYSNSEPPSELFNKIVSTIKTKLEGTTGVEAITAIENAVQQTIDDTVLELAASELELFKLEEEVALLLQNQCIEVTEQESAEQMEEDTVNHTESEGIFVKPKNTEESVEAPPKTEATEVVAEMSSSTEATPEAKKPKQTPRRRSIRTQSKTRNKLSG